MSDKATPVGGPVLTRSFNVLVALFAVACAIIVIRLFKGLGAVTALNDGYPWGLWIAYDVLVGAALATGGYAVALLVYILNKGKYHPLIRPALVTSALGYSLAGLSVVIDIGRWWNVWKVPLFWGDYNLNSILLEVALCIMAYTVVLWIEISPAFMERWQESKRPWLAKFSRNARPKLEKILLPLIALGLVLPTMHQSSLGSLFIIAGQKVHPLWQTPLLPLLFLISCIGMGYAAVVIESGLSSRLLRRKPETKMLASLGVAAAVVTGIYLVVRFVDLAWQGKLGLTFTSGGLSVLFWAEIALFLTPIAMLVTRQQRYRLGNLFRAAMFLALAGGLYRFSTSLIAFNPGNGWTYFPSVGETLVTTGFVAFEVLAYIYLIKRFPILAGEPSKRPAAAAPQARPATIPATAGATRS
jgi:Ni/Fe-hydrogenase subunit HybB-like protein